MKLKIKIRHKISMTNIWITIFDKLTNTIKMKFSHL